MRRRFAIISLAHSDAPASLTASARSMTFGWRLKIISFTHSDAPTSLTASAQSMTFGWRLVGFADNSCSVDDLRLKTDVENAISSYATELPSSIKIASKTEYNEVYLTANWVFLTNYFLFLGQRWSQLLMNWYISSFFLTGAKKWFGWSKPIPHKNINNVKWMR